MAAKKRPARHRVGRVSYYQHHGSWYVYYRDASGIHRPRIGRSESDAERAAALKNAELTTGEVSSGQQLVIAPPAPPGCGDVDRRSFVANVAALLGGLLELGQGLNANAAFPALSAPTIDVPPEPLPGPATPVATLRDEFVDHHEHVLGSSLGTVKRYSSATQHLVDYAVREGIANARDISASKFTRYLREIEVAANGHNNAAPRSMSEKTISFMLQTCGSMYRFGVDQKLLPQDADRTFRIRGIRKLKTRRTKPIFVFDAANELKFFQAADPWAFAIHLTLAKTGLRPGELAHTLIEELDLDAGWWRVRGKPELGWMVKTGTDRDVPLAPEVCHVLKIAIGNRTAGPVFRRVKVTPGNPPALTGDRAHLTRVAANRLAHHRVLGVATVRPSRDHPDHRTVGKSLGVTRTTASGEVLLGMAFVASAMCNQIIAVPVFRRPLRNLPRPTGLARTPPLVSLHPEIGFSEVKIRGLSHSSRSSKWIGTIRVIH